MTHTANTRKVAIALAFAGGLLTPFSLTWLHKFYMGQYLWGLIYLVLTPTKLPQVACCLEGIWYLSQSDDSFADRFPNAGSMLSAAKISLHSADSAVVMPADHTAIQVATALRELDQLRQDGLMTEYEFEQKRRKLLEKIA
ncbi:MAG: hypothetical protein HC800_08385 [Phormidesmis sp. RL_2_1]|nr:hypothetical protein [Phormidesmis sp. RL_2_1]